METPAVQKMAVLTLIDPRTDQVEYRTVTGSTPAAIMAAHLLDFCVRHCLAPSNVRVSLSTMNKHTHKMLSRLERAGISTDDAIALRHIAMTLHRWHELECGTGDHDMGRIPDREKGALKRLETIMARYPYLMAYVQGDPRGAPLYIVSSDDIPAGEDISAYYSRGIAVYHLQELAERVTLN